MGAEMTDLFSGLCMLVFFGIFVLFIIYALSRSKQSAEADVPRHRPHYDDDDIRSSGGFGRPAPPPNPTYDDPDIRSSGSIGKPPRPKNRKAGGGFGGVLGKRPAKRNDDDKIESSGSFGGR